MRRLLSLFFLFFSFSLYSQGFSLGKVAIAELQEKYHSSDSSAAAAVLYKRGNSYLDISGVKWIMVTEVEARVKIYNTGGLGYAHIAVPYHIYPTGPEEVVFSDAITYNLSGTKIVKTKLKELTGFIEDVSNIDKLKKITLPNVTEGSVIEYKYIVRSPDISAFSNWKFMEDIPVNAAEYSIAVPQGFEYNRKIDSTFSLKISEQSYRRNIQLQMRKMTFNEAKSTYAAGNLPALKQGNNNADDNIPVKYELVKVPGIDDFYEKHGINWDNIAKLFYEDISQDINKSSYFAKELDEVLKGKELRDDRIAAVFNYLKSRMSWNEYGGYTRDNTLEKAYTDKTGNSGTINLMLIAMLQYAGLNAHPVLINTDKDRTVSGTSQYDFNYLVVGVESQNEIILLDATSKNALPGILPFRALNDKGRLIRKDFTHREVDLAPVKSSLESTLIVATIEPDGKVTGQIKTKLHDYNAFLYREYNALISEAHIRDEYIGKKEKWLNNVKIESYAVANMKELGEPVEESFNFKAENLCNVMENKIFISPMMMYIIEENPFKENDRDTPVYFSYPYQDRYVISINIPEGYRVDFVPGPLNMSTRDNMSSFKFNVAVNNNKIQVVATKEINVTKVGPEHYETLKEFYANMIQKQTEKIVLIKN